MQNAVQSRFLNASPAEGLLALDAAAEYPSCLGLNPKFALSHQSLVVLFDMKDRIWTMATGKRFKGRAWDPTFGCVGVLLCVFTALCWVLCGRR